MENNDNFAILAKRLKQIRTEKGMTQKEFAQEMGFTSTTLSAYENNLKKPSLDLMLEVAKKCDVSLDWLCGLSDTQFKQKYETYADILRTFIEIEDNTLVFDIKNLDTSLAEHLSSNHIKKYKIAICLFDGILENYLIKWNKFKQLRNDKVIDDEIYIACIEKLLRDANDEEIFPF